MSPIAVSADRRFHRAHVKPSRKRGRLRSLVWPAVKVVVITLIAIVALFRGADMLARAPMLKVDRVLITGNSRMSTAAVLDALGGLKGENILWTDLDVWRARLQTSPWVRDVTLRRSLPSTIEVALVEREPIGIGRSRGQLFLVDERGGVIDEYGPAYADFDLPIIDGLPSPQAAEGAADDGRGELAARVLLAFRAKPTIARRVSQIDVSDLHNAAVLVTDDPARIYVGDDLFLVRLESYLGLAEALRARVSEIDYVDTRFDGRIYVRPSAGPKSSSTSTARRPALNRVKAPHD